MGKDQLLYCIFLLSRGSITQSLASLTGSVIYLDFYVFSVQLKKKKIFITTSEITVKKSNGL